MVKQSKRKITKATKRAGIQIEQQDKNVMTGVRVAPITAKELVLAKADRKMVLLGKLAEYKINPQRQLYIRVGLQKGYMLIGQPVDENYNPDFFIVEHEGEQYKFVKMRKTEDVIFNSEKKDE